MRSWETVSDCTRVRCRTCVLHYCGPIHLLYYFKLYIPTYNVIIVKIIIYIIRLYGATKCHNRDVKQLALKNYHYEAPCQRLVNTHARIYRYTVFINELRIYRYGNLATICYRFVMILVCSTTDDITYSIIAELSGVFPFYSFSAK